MASFWDHAPRQSLMSFFSGMIFGPPKEDICNPPKRLDAVAAATASQQHQPTGLSKYEPLTIDTIHEYRQFLYNFWPRPQYIIQDITADISSGVLRPLIVRDANTKQIVGTIASLSIGRLRRNGEQEATPYQLRMIRDFCVAPQWRSKGLGSYLLWSVWHDLSAIGEDAVLFLKEGAALGRAGPSLYSGTWLYRRMREAENVSNVEKIQWNNVPAKLKVYTKGKVNCLFNILGRQPTHSIVLEYKTFRGSILAAFTKTHQCHPADNEWICYQTGWLEKGELLDLEKNDAAQQLSAAAAALLQCYWVWIDENSIAVKDGTWSKDGQYHWYPFHWTPSIYKNAELFLLW
jgi:hypothetical protein